MWEERTERGRWCRVTWIWWYSPLRIRNDIFSWICPLFSSPPPPSCFIPQLICPLEVTSPPCCPRRAQGSLSNADECLWEKISVYMHNDMSAPLPWFTLFNYQEERSSDGCSDQGDSGRTSGDDSESQASEIQHWAVNWQIDSQSLRQMVGEVLRGHLASGKITVSQSMAYDCRFPCSLQSCHWTNAH